MSEAVTVFAPQLIRIRKIEIDRPWSWLAKGFKDFRSTPTIGLVYGVLAALTGYVLTFGLIAIGAIYLVLPLASGFLLVGPLLTVGLYEASRRTDQGLPISLFEALLAFRRNALQIALMGVALMVFFFAWVRLASLLFFLYWGLEPPSVENLLVNTFLSPKGWPFLMIGTAVGGVLAFIAYSISVVSIPLLLDREDANVIEAIATSVRAVQVNFGPMLLWAALITIFVAFGLVTAYLGLIVTLPVIGHASWHAYRDLVEFGEAGGA